MNNYTIIVIINIFRMYVLRWKKMNNYTIIVISFLMTHFLMTEIIKKYTDIFENVIPNICCNLDRLNSETSTV